MGLVILPSFLMFLYWLVRTVMLFRCPGPALDEALEVDYYRLVFLSVVVGWTALVLIPLVPTWMLMAWIVGVVSGN